MERNIYKWECRACAGSPCSRIGLQEGRAPFGNIQQCTWNEVNKANWELITQSAVEEPKDEGIK